MDKTIKVKLFTHTDLDGIGCEIVGRLAFKNIDVTYCDYHNINDIIEKFIMDKGYEGYDIVFITDISVNDHVAELIENFVPDKVRLLDHHQTALWLNDVYEWSYVETENEKVGIQSGTTLLFEHLLSYHDTFRNENGSYVKFMDALRVFVEKVRRYDSWDWKNIYNDNEARSLNQLFYLLGRESFADKYVNKFLNNDLFVVEKGFWTDMFDESDKAILNVDNAKRYAYINKKNKQMFKANLLKYNTGVVFAEQYISELGNELAEMNPDLDFITIIDMGNKKVSYRTVKDINLGQDIAGKFGGGGHPRASGSQFNENILKLTYTLIFAGKSLSEQLINVITKRGLIGKISSLIDKIHK